ncbi:MAG: hypothetical protein HIU83_03795 [Proteobacteria bacterium]|nr:hypothetical protein [Pseudomonadota bacterium]
MSVSEIVPLLVSFLLGMCVMTFAAYIKAKRSKRMLLGDVPKLADKQPIALSGDRSEARVIEHPQLRQRDIAAAEKIKQQRVDIVKRECPLDEKRQQFVNYFTLLDEFHRKNNEIFTLQFHPIMNRFLASNAAKDKSARNSAIAEFNREVQSLFNQLYDEQQKVISETDGIRSFSSETLDGLLVKLQSAVKQSTDDTAEVLKFMATPEQWADQSLATPIQKAEKTVQLVLTCRDAVRRRMKVDLDDRLWV